MDLKILNTDTEKLLADSNDILGFSLFGDREFLSQFLLDVPLHKGEIVVDFPILKLVPDAILGMEKMDRVGKSRTTFEEMGRILLDLIKRVCDAIEEAMLFRCVMDLKDNLLTFDIGLYNKEGNKVKEEAFNLYVSAINYSLAYNHIGQYANSIVETFERILKEWEIYYSPCLLIPLDKQ